MNIKTYLFVASIATGAAMAAPEYDVEYVTSTTPSTAHSSTVTAPLRLNVGYGFSAKRSRPYECDILEGELSTAFPLNRYHALTLSLSYAYGGEEHKGWRKQNGHVELYNQHFDRNLIAAMGGYELTLFPTRAINLCLGAKAGPELHILKVDNGPYPPSKHEPDRTHSTLGLAYSAYAGLSFMANRDHTVSLDIGYALRGSTATPRAATTTRYTTGTDPLLWHEIRLGVTARF